MGPADFPRLLPSTGATLPPELIDALAQEARARRRKPDALMREWLHNLAAEREARELDRIAREPGRPWSEIKKELDL